MFDAATPPSDFSLIRDRWLTGEVIDGFAHHEDERYFGTNLAAKYRREGSDFVLSASKLALIDGGIVDYLIVSARDEQAPHDVALFLLPITSTDLNVDVQRSFDGRNLATVECANLPVAISSVIASAEAAENLIDNALSRYSLLLASESLGIMRAVLALTYRYLNEREQFGQKIADFQALQHRLVDLSLHLSRSASLIEPARQQCDSGGLAAAAPSVAAAKIKTDAAAAVMAQEAVQLHGAIGMTDEYVLAHYFKRLTANRLIAGERGEYLLRAREYEI